MARASEKEIGHLLRRAGFGPSPEEMREYTALGYDGAVERVVGGLKQAPPDDPSGFDPYTPNAITSRWLERALTTKAPLAEKLALFWHGHFATSVRKVEDPEMMWRQMGTFRALGAGKFSALVAAVSRDPAMIRWLDGNSNRKGAPNENYARELMELFTTGRGVYTETDVREAARAFTGWGAESGRFVFRREYHDEGAKTLLGERGNFDGDDVVRIVTSRPECARFLSRKLLAFFSHPEASEGDVRSTAAVFTATGGDLTAVLRHIFNAPAFRSPAAYRSLVKSPVEFALGAVKVAGLAAAPPGLGADLGRMGQTLFAPPTVKGWDGERAWLGAGTLLERMRFAARLAPAAHAPEASVLLAFDGAAPPEIASALAGSKGAERLALALASPEFQLN